ncbi:hypothetical protein AHAS_Ahas01G0175900 [Arachis hypogaea]
MNWRATPNGSSGTPMVCNGLGVPRPFCGLQHCFMENDTGVPRSAGGVPRPC